MRDKQSFPLFPKFYVFPSLFFHLFWKCIFETDDEGWAVFWTKREFNRVTLYFPSFPITRDTGSTQNSESWWQDHSRDGLIHPTWTAFNHTVMLQCFLRTSPSQDRPDTGSYLGVGFRSMCLYNSCWLRSHKDTSTSSVEDLWLQHNELQ